MDHIITRTLIAAAAMTLGYAALVQVYHPLFHKAPSIDMTNRIYLENYVYGTPAPSVLVGSSLTQRIPDEALGPDFQNLALSGDGALTGLAIAANSPVHPKRILIEINKIDRGVNNALVRDIFADPLFTLRRHVAALRVSYRPMNYLYGILRGGVGGQGVEAAPELNAEQTRAVTAESARNDAVLLPPQTLADDIQILTSLVAKARARGIEPILYELPIEPALVNYPRPAQIRASVRQALPPSQICWLDLSLPGGAHTYDGEHLMAADSIAMAKTLRAEPACLQQ